MSKIFYVLFKKKLLTNRKNLCQYWQRHYFDWWDYRSKCVL